MINDKSEMKSPGQASNSFIAERDRQFANSMALADPIPIFEANCDKPDCPGQSLM